MSLVFSGGLHLWSWSWSLLSMVLFGLRHYFLYSLSSLVFAFIFGLCGDVATREEEVDFFSQPVGRSFKNAVQVGKIRPQKREKYQFLFFFLQVYSLKNLKHFSGHVSINICEPSVEKFDCPPLQVRFVSLWSSVVVTGCSLRRHLQSSSLFTIIFGHYRCLCRFDL